MSGIKDDEVAAVVFQVLYPSLNEPNGPGWRMFFWLDAAPAVLALWIALRVRESPVWLARPGPTD